MNKGSLCNWKNISNLQGLLFFAQRTDEMLFHYSLDTYKAPIFNIRLLLQEYLYTLQDIEKGLLKEKNEIPILEEIIWNLKKDEAAQQVIGKDMVKQFIKDYGSLNKDLRRRYCKLFLDKLSGTLYVEEVKRCLRDAINDNRKREIEEYSKAFIRELTVTGYNSRYIFVELKDIFFNKIVRDITSLDTFFQCFDMKKHSFAVYLTVHKDLARLSEMVSNGIIKDEIQVLSNNEIPKGIHCNSGYNIVELHDIKTYDRYSSYDIGKHLMALLSHFYSFYHYTEEGILQDGFVKDKDSRVKLVKESISGLQKSKRIKTVETSAIGAVNLFDIATTNYANLYNLSRVMEIRNMAMRIHAPGNALLSLWSILELLLEKKETDNGNSRISNIVNLVMPFLVNSYIEKIVNNLYEDMIHWDSEYTDSIIENINFGNTKLDKLLGFLLLDEYVDNRKKLYARLDDFPLLRFRIFYLNDTFGNKKKTKKTIEGHKQKIHWQLQRIYRARNCIIHDGDDVMNVESLIENLLSYIDIICERIIQKISENGKDYTVSDAILEENIQSMCFLGWLNNEEKIDSSNCLMLLNHNY